MKKTTISTLPDPHGFSPDPLTEILRAGARDLIQHAVEAELSALLEAHSDDRIVDGPARLVRHGHLPEREVTTGIGTVSVKVPRVRDRGEGAEKIRFTSTILPPCLRKAKSIEELLPWLYLKGISTGDFQEALAALPGPNAAGLSSTTISRLSLGNFTFRNLFSCGIYLLLELQDFGALGHQIIFQRTFGGIGLPRWTFRTDKIKVDFFGAQLFAELIKNLCAIFGFKHATAIFMHISLIQHQRNPRLHSEVVLLFRTDLRLS